jgi:hypothetical protein
MWLRDYVDGLRLDAVHALDYDRSVHLLEELAAEVDALAVRLVHTAARHYPVTSLSGGVGDQVEVMVVVVLVLLSGCGDDRVVQPVTPGTGAAPSATPVDPLALIGSWRVADASGEEPAARSPLWSISAVERPEHSTACRA